MNCKRARWLLSLEARGELDTAESEALREHRSQCARCRAATGAGQRLDIALRTCLSHLTPGIDLRPEVMRRIEQATPPRPAWPRWARIGAPAAAAAAALVLAGVLIVPRFRTQAPTFVTAPGLPSRPVPAVTLGAVQAAVGATLVREGATGTLSKWAELRDGDLLRSGAEHTTRLQLADGTKVLLDRASAASLSRDGLHLERGRLLADVAHQNASTFAISTPQARAEVIGTEFSVEISPLGNTIVTVERGLVRVSNPEGETLVPAGSFTVVRENVAPLEPEELDTASVLSWAAELDPGLKSPTESWPVPADLAAELATVREQVEAKRVLVSQLRRGMRQLRSKVGAAGNPVTSQEQP